MHIVLDTNVLISATFWTGASFRILQLIEQGKATLVLSRTTSHRLVAWKRSRQ